MVAFAKRPKPFVTGGLMMIILMAAGVTALGQRRSASGLEAAWMELDRGAFDAALNQVSKYKTQDRARRSDASLLEAYIHLGAERFADAEAVASSELSSPNSTSFSPDLKSEFLFIAAEAARKQRRFEDALRLATEGRLAGKGSKFAEGVYALRLAQVFVSKGYDVSALIWLKKAEELLSAAPRGFRLLLEVYRFQVFSYSAKLAHPSALSASDRLLKLTAGSRYQFAYRNALYVRGGLLSSTGQSAKSDRAFALALDLAKKAGDDDLAQSLLSTIALNRLIDLDPKAPADALAMVEQMKPPARSTFEAKVIKAAALGISGRVKESESIFAELEAGEVPSPFMLQAWQIIVADRTQRFEMMLDHLSRLRVAVESGNYRDDQIFIEYMTAKAFAAMGRREEALSHAESAIRLVEELRGQSGSELSLEILNLLHGAYRIAAEAETSDTGRALKLVENLKARVLRDRLNGLALHDVELISESERERFKTLADRFIVDPTTEPELKKAEQDFTSRAPKSKAPDIQALDLDSIESLRDCSVVSYFFTAAGDLIGFVWDLENGVRRTRLSLNALEADNLTEKVRDAIRNRVFFKRDGKLLFDRLLKPLGPFKKHIVLAPDRSLWLVPFQALSPDGERYLIEDYMISYSPSLVLLADQLRRERPIRPKIIAFANSSFEGRSLQFVNSEALTVTRLYGSPAVLDATIDQFRIAAPKADIIHLSMHAAVDPERALDSYLGFRRGPKNNGRLSAESLLDFKLRNRSLVFIASCDTNTVNNAEGLVSLAWAMTAAGATTVVSANWEANDRSTSEFATAFYRSYKSGSTSAAAMQVAARSLIDNKSADMHEPYYWAAFSLSGDFR